MTKIKYALLFLSSLLSIELNLNLRADTSTHRTIGFNTESKSEIAAAEEQDSLWLAFSEARRSIRAISTQHAELPENEGVRYFAYNARNELTIRFKEDGSVTLQPDQTDQDWNATFRLYGMQAPTSIQAFGTRVEIAYANGIIEYYQNQAEGIEQGWVVLQNPGQADHLSIPISVEGLYSGPSEGGIQFQTGMGEPVLNYDQLKAWDAHGNALEASMSPTGNGIEIVVATADAVFPVFIDPLITAVEAKLRPEISGYAALYDSFGCSVSIDGNTAVIGAELDDDVAINAGSAYVFVLNGGVWEQQAKLTASAPSENARFGASVSISGDNILIGSTGESVNDIQSGTAYVFTRNGSNWNQQAKLVASDAESYDNFGESVSIANHTALIGAPNDDDGGSLSGSAYIFTRSGDTWSQQSKLTALDAATSDRFGAAVSLDNGTALIGAYGDDDHGGSSGSAYVFIQDGNIWTQQAKLVASDAESYDYFGNSVSIDGHSALIGASSDDDNGNSSGSAYVFTRSGAIWSQQAKLVASDAESYDNFGESVSIEGDRALIGSEKDDGGALQSGSAYLYTRNGDTWSEQSKLTINEDYYGHGNKVSLSGDHALIGARLSDDCLNPPANGAFVHTMDGPSWTLQELHPDGPGDASEGSHYGTSTSIDGNTALIGASGDPNAGIATGSAYVFIRNGNLWAIQGILTANDGAADDQFGAAVSLDNNTALVGATGDDDAGLSSGSAYVFTRNGDTWSQQSKLTASDAESYDYFGSRVSLDNDTALIGAYRNDDNSDDSGSAYVFIRTNESWSQQSKLTASDAESYDYFGYALSLDNDTALIGARGDDDNGEYSGSAYVFIRNDTVWTEETKLMASDAESGDYFGYALSLDNNTVLIGAFRDYDLGSNSGSAYVFIRNGETWTEQAKLMPSDAESYDYFGSKVSLDNDTALIGAYGNDDNGTNSGSAYVFTRTGETWSEQTKFVASIPKAYAEFGSSVSIDGNTVLIGSSGDHGIDIAGAGSQDQGSTYVFRIYTTASDDDEDGASNNFENQNGFDPNDPNDIKNQDRDQDGIIDLLEIFQNTDKNDSDSRYGMYAVGDQSGPNTFVARFRRSTEDTGILGRTRWSVDLENWLVSGEDMNRIKVDLSEKVLSSGADYEIIEVTATVTAGESDKMFLRFELLPIE